MLDLVGDLRDRLDRGDDRGTLAPPDRDAKLLNGVLGVIASVHTVTELADQLEQLTEQLQ